MIKKLNKSHLLTILLCLLLSTDNLYPQHKNDLEAGLFNIGFGGIVGGIGAMINKKPNEKIDKVFLKGFGQGALGGYLLFESKRLVRQFNKTEKYAYVWPSKIINSAATSIIENAAANRNFWERWHINIGFNRFEFYTKGIFKVSYRIMPFALGATFYGFTQGKLAIYSSLKTGTFVFAVDDIKSNNEIIPNGVAYANIIFYKKNDPSKTNIIAHELIHNYQYESFSGFNTYLNKPFKKWNNENLWLKKYHKIFYTDYNYLFFSGLYNINNEYSTNFFENEARYYTE